MWIYYLCALLWDPGLFPFIVNITGVYKGHIEGSSLLKSRTDIKVIFCALNLSGHVGIVDEME